MRLLWVVTKPPWPEREGGRVVVAHTLRALRAAGHELVLVSPFDPARDDRARLAAALREYCEPHLVPAVPRPIVRSLLIAARRDVPITIGRHTLPAVGAEVERLVAGSAFAVVHAEQLQALAQCEAARRRGVPVALRAQNVESDLWSGAARGLLSRLARWEARRLARYEGRAAREAAATIALTERDADRLRALAGGGGRIRRVPAPFAERLAAAAAPLAGEPAVVVLASGWLPNRDGAAWFRRAVWPEVQTRCPRAVLHLFGSTERTEAAPTVVVHEAPADSRAAFSTGAILAVPLRIASGVRIKILEAWARGVPVVATPEAAAGLDTSAEEELLIAADPGGFARAIDRLHADAAFARASVEAGRALLRTRHDPARVADELTRVYTEVAHP